MQRLATLGNRTHGSGMYWYMDLKTQVVAATGLSMDALHIHIGMAAFVIACFVLRRKAGDLAPFLLVMLLAIAGEVLDLQGQLSRELPLDMGESVHDIVNTTAIPFIVSLLARFSAIFERKLRDETEPVAPAAGSDGDIGETGDLA